MLVANELVANAIVHAQSAPVLSLEESGADLLLRVADDSRAPAGRESAEAPTSHGPGPDARGGARRPLGLRTERRRARACG